MAFLQPVGWSPKNQESNLPASEVLLIWNTLINCDQDMEAAGFSGIEQLSILQSCKPSKPSGLTVVIREKKTEAFIDALVE